MGESFLAQSIFQSYVVNLSGLGTLADLILLEMADFDVILGIDWLALCHATVDCLRKEVRFEIPEGPSFVFKGNNCLTPFSLISSLSALHLMRKGNHGFLAVLKIWEPRCSI